MTHLTLCERDASTLRAYIETGEMLLATFRMDGFFAQMQLHAEDSMSTLVIAVSGTPDTVRAVLEQRGIAHEIVDYHEGLLLTAATWKVTLFGHELAVASTKRRAEKREVA